MPVDYICFLVYKNFRTDSVLRVATVIALCGICFRLYSYINEEFWPILFGNFLMASVYGIYRGSFIMIANKWFPDDERVLATTILCTAEVIGYFCSYALDAIVYGSKYDTDTMTKDE